MPCYNCASVFDSFQGHFFEIYEHVKVTLFKKKKTNELPKRMDFNIFYQEGMRVLVIKGYFRNFSLGGSMSSLANILRM